MAREMKDSGIEWIGEIPENWEYVRLKHFYEFEKGKNATQYTQEYIGLHSGNYPVYSGQTENSGIMGKIETFDYDIAECLFTTTVGAKVMTPKILWGKFSLSQNCLIMKQIKKCNNKFFYYTLLPLFDYEKSLIPAYMQPSLRIEDLKKYAFFIPVESEQQNIANFLDKKCSELDKILEKTRASIEEYKKLKQAVITQAVTKGIRGDRKMKDSGIEWIGEIPKNYDVYRLKYLLKRALDYGANSSGVEYTSHLPRYIRITDITVDGKLKNDGALSLKEEDASPYILEDQDILLARSGATVGKSFIYHAKYGRSAFAGYLIRARLKENIVPEYVYYYTCSAGYDIWKNGIFIQSTIQNIGADKYANLPIVLPDTKDEQIEIVEYLNKKVGEIDNLIKKKEQYLSEIENYKKSLIYEYVTGKKEVPQEYRN